MFEVFTQLCGGIGLFLLGMTLMTESLKDIAGETLRQWLGRFTGSPFKAMTSGIALTLIVQSSTATTLATIGFVSAGVLSFSQAIGVIIGANIGTTSTGWIVAFLGLKFSIGQVALPLIAIGALLKILAHGRTALTGLALAGFGLIFFGIDLLQVAMSGVAEHLDLSIFSTESFAAKLLLVLFGLVMTVILQSSSAAITATLAALASQAIQLDQALVLVIGQNIGTVATAVLAAIGANANAKRTAAVHVCFNVVSAIFAFCILVPLFLWLYQPQYFLSGWDHVVIVAAFHTAFSVFGALFFMPLIRPFEQLLVKYIPAHEDSLLQALDEASLAVPAVAINTAEQVIFKTILTQYSWILKAIKSAELVSANELKQQDELIYKLQDYLEKIVVPENSTDQSRLFSLLRMMVYLKVLRSDLENLKHVVSIRTQPAIHQLALDFIQILENAGNSMLDTRSSEDLSQLYIEMGHLKQWSKQHRSELRKKTNIYASTYQLNAAKTFELLAAQRWLDRLVAHSYRLINVLNERQQTLTMHQIDDEHV